MNYYAETLRQTIDPEQQRQPKAWCSASAKKVYADTIAKQILKFERLTSLPHQIPRIDKYWVVRNLSNRTLTEEEEVPALGLNYATMLKQIPMLDIIHSSIRNHWFPPWWRDSQTRVSSVLNSWDQGRIWVGNCMKQSGSWGETSPSS